LICIACRRLLPKQSWNGGRMQHNSFRGAQPAVASHHLSRALYSAPAKCCTHGQSLPAHTSPPCVKVWLGAWLNHRHCDSCGSLQFHALGGSSSMVASCMCVRRAAVGRCRVGGQRGDRGASIRAATANKGWPSAGRSSSHVSSRSRTHGLLRTGGNGRRCG
jgi:hypothetical protein